ncbi:MAG: NAD(P)/FAD-dependent oxidoreductase [Candidatus Moranbacteria bacterium]|nr:NAD(P)/FAD-dependent oxidoreductase [Candidatus Moranbacteria bacterium]
MKNNREKFDVAVIGGGPAGMMAASRAAELGACVVLLEKNESLGKKLLITGKGRCNLTRDEVDLKELVSQFGQNGKFLFSSLAEFGPRDVMKFFEDAKLPVKTERGGRVFPVSNKSYDVLRVMEDYLKKNKVKIIFGSEIVGFESDGKKIKGVKLKHEKGKPGNRTISAEKFILCTGGKSYPLTGSTGDGYQWAKDLGHTIIAPVPALVPIKTKETWVKDVQGLSLKNVEIKLIQNDKIKDSRFGEMLFTHFGLSGPVVLDVSKEVGQLAANGEVAISIDLKPALSAEQLDTRLQRDFANNGKKDFVNYLPELLPQKMIATIIKLSGIDPRKKVSAVTGAERKKLVNLLKDLRLTADGTAGFDQAVITSGGVNLKEVNSKTMQSRIVDNLFFAGEILDVDGPTGGYNLQICWSTGYAAGTYAA